MHWSRMPLASRMNSTASRARAVAAGVRRDVVRLGLDAFARVGHGHRETDFAHGRQIDHVVADVADLVERHAFFRDDLADGLHLEGAALVDEFELQVAGARGDGLADALGDDAALQPAEARQRNRSAVVRAVAFGLDHRRGVNAVADGVFSANLIQNSALRKAWDEPDGAVGPYAIHVEKNDLDFAGAVLRGECHYSILPGAPRSAHATDAAGSRENRSVDRDSPRNAPQLRPDSRPKITTSTGRISCSLPRTT